GFVGKVAVEREDRGLTRGRPDPRELRDVELDPLHPGELSEGKVPIEGPDREPVGPGEVVDVVGRDDAIRSRHVLDDDRGLAGDVLGEMAGKEAGGPIVTATRFVAYDNGDHLSVVRLRGPPGRNDCEH